MTAFSAHAESARKFLMDGECDCTAVSPSRRRQKECRFCAVLSEVDEMERLYEDARRSADEWRALATTGERAERAELPAGEDET